jgi:hypothetical protein
MLGRGQTLADLMPALGATSAGKAIARLLETDPDDEMVAAFGAEGDLVRILQYPSTASHHSSREDRVAGLA